MNKVIFKKTVLGLLSFALLIILFSQTSAFAQGRQYTPLEPLPGIVNSSGKTDIATYIPAVFTLLIAIAGGLAVIMIVIGGFQYVSTDSLTGKKEGKERITNAIIGLLLAIASYIILNTINPQILNFNLRIPGAPQSTPPTTTPPPPPPSGSCNINSSTSCTGSSCLNLCPTGSNWVVGNDPQNRSTLSSVGISVNNPNCQRVGDRGCTSLAFLSSRAMSGLQWLGNNCSNCNIVVTGGTEFWLHSSHGPGMGRVDLRLNGTLDNFIKTRGTSVGGSNICFNGQPAWILNGATFVLENNNHWHICF